MPSITIKNPFRAKSVATITASLGKMVVELRDHADAERVRAAEIGLRMNELAAEQDTANSEAAAASKAADKIAKLLD